MRRTTQRLRLPTTRSGELRELPVLELDSGTTGPTAVITANVHGDECTGVAVVHELASRLERTLLKGRVALYPSVNPLALTAGSRRVPEDDIDLNRIFPGDERGGWSERHARRLWDDIVGRNPNLVVDLHTDTAPSIPYAILDRTTSLPDAVRQVFDERLLGLAHATGLTVLHEYPDDRYQRFALDRSLTGALVNRARIPALTLEAGPRRWIDPDAVSLTTRAVEALLSQLSMTRSEGPAPTRAIPGGPWRRESGPRTTRAGLFLPRVRPGETFQRGEMLGELRSLSGVVLEKLLAPARGLVVAFPERTWLPVGTSIGTIAVGEQP